MNRNYIIFASLKQTSHLKTLDSSLVPFMNELETLYSFNTKPHLYNCKQNRSDAWTSVMAQEMTQYMRTNMFKMSGYSISAVPIDQFPKHDGMMDFTFDLCVSSNTPIHAFMFLEIDENNNYNIHYKKIATTERNEPKSHKNFYTDCNVNDIIHASFRQSQSRMDDTWEHLDAIQRYFLVSTKKKGSMIMHELHNFNPETYECTSMGDPIEVKRKTISNTYVWDYFHRDYYFQDAWDICGILCADVLN